jgi:protein TonB
MRLPAASEFDLSVPPGTGDWRRPSARRRAAAIGLTLLAELLFLVVLLALSPKLPVKLLPQPQAVSFDLQPVSPATRKPQPKRTLKASAKPQKQKPAITPPPIALPPPKLPMVAVTADELAAGDISKLGSKGAGPSQSATAAVGPGEGPGGAHLYNAEWYREPTDAELDYYLPKAVDRGSWAMIGCRTIDHYHVDNCYLLGESPMGSGLARAMRLAAWQFLVRPPRIDGKPLVGSWVRIRIDFTEGGAKSGG